MLATFTVTNTLDAAAPPAGSLRAAIVAANANPGADLIQFASGLGPTIELAAGAGELPITESLTIRGPGFATLTIDATMSVSRIFRIDAGDVVIKGLTLANANAGAGNGGAIFSGTFGTLSIADSVITGSTAIDGGGIFTTGDLILTNVKVGGVTVGAGANFNTATSDGGGIFSALGSVILKSSDVLSNDATAGAGGGIHAQFSTVTLQNSTVADNTATTGAGGIFATTVVAQRSTISGNTATTGDGGGILAFTSILQNSTVYNNEATAAGDGGGIHSTNVTLQNATVAMNRAVAGAGGGIFAVDAGVLTIHNSIVATNTALTFPDVRPPGGAVPVNTTVRYSLIGDIGTIPSLGQFLVTGPGAQNAEGNFIGNAAMPISQTDAFGAGGGALANNGGRTQTVALMEGPPASIAINKGLNSLAVNVNQGDQRGLPFARISPLGAPNRVDMGAFELQEATLPNTIPSLAVPAPAISLNQTATVGAAFSVSTAGFFFDPDVGDTLTFAAERINGGVPMPPGELPAWLTFNTSTGVLSGIPTEADITPAGGIQIRVTATDNKTAPATSPPLPSITLTLNVVAAAVVPPVPPPVVVALPVTETFDTVVPPALPPSIQVQTPAFATIASPTLANPANNVLQATRPTVGARPVATFDMSPATAAMVQNISVTASADPGNGTSLWSNAVVVFDFQSPTNYKFAGMFQIINRLIIGEVRNGVVQYRKIRAFPVTANQEVLLNVAINRATSTVTLTANGGNAVTHTFASIGNGTSGVGTINANAKFDNLMAS